MSRMVKQLQEGWLHCFLFQVRAKFTVDDYSHYFFTPCILTQWVLGLFRYDLEGGEFWLSLCVTML